MKPGGIAWARRNSLINSRLQCAIVSGTMGHRRRNEHQAVCWSALGASQATKLMMVRFVGAARVRRDRQLPSVRCVSGLYGCGARCANGDTAWGGDYANGDVAG